MKIDFEKSLVTLEPYSNFVTKILYIHQTSVNIHYKNSIVSDHIICFNRYALRLSVIFQGYLCEYTDLIVRTSYL